MKSAILHDWLVGFRGGERVLDAICELLPDSPLYTLIYNPKTTSDIIENRKIVTSFLNKLPNIYSNYRNYLPLFPYATEQIKIDSDTEFIFSSSHCTIKGIKKNLPETKHVCYIHSPMRYMYDQYDNYFGPHAPLHVQLGAKIFRNYLTNWDIRSNTNVDHFIANSNFVKKRIENFYKRDCSVIYPFVDLNDFSNIPETTVKADYYLMVTAFAPNKRVDLAIETFNDLNQQLIIIGSGQNEAVLKNKAKKNIRFLGNLDRHSVIQYMSKAKGFIFPGVEDFGITPLESLAAKTPVIAFKAGGVLETLNESNSIFFNEPTSDSLKNAILEFEKMTFKHDSLIDSVQKFSRENFQSNIKNTMAHFGYKK